MTCTNCGKEVADVAGKCPDCGAALKVNQPPTDTAKPEESQVCRACGAPLRENVRFCTRCGTRVQTNSQDNVQHGEKETRNPDEKKSKGRLGGISVPLITVLTVSAVIIIFVLISIAPKRNEKDFLADMQEDTMQQEDEAPIAETDKGIEIEKDISAADTSQKNTIGNTMSEMPEKPEIIQLNPSYVRSIYASSELTDTTKTYKAETLLDGDRETCWSEGADGTGEGEYIYIEFTCPVYLSEISFLNGYMKNESVYHANGKIKRALISVDGEDFEAEFCDWQYDQVEYSLYTDNFVFDEPVRTQYLQITILEGQKGTKYDDICVTETDLWGYAEEGIAAGDQTMMDEPISIYDLYGTVLFDYESAYGSDCEYAAYDMDDDGVEELIVSWGTSAADWTNTVYTVDSSANVVEVGEFYGLVSLYESENGDGIYSVYGHMGYQQVEWITKHGNELYTETILAEETEEYYQNDNPIPMAGIKDGIARSE
ncbi:MAG: zinc-ribbon domain-containing protein [Lachnospiraceae bacterium]|nr:zinc-ribbon domain-containing protein [Lachnospiraceae bacterium]